MVSDRLVGAVCVGLAALGATWGGNTTWRVPESGLQQAARPAPSHVEAGPGPEAATTITASETTETTLPAGEAGAPTPPVSGSSTTTTVAAVPPAPGEEAARAIAREAVLVAGDLPPGFVTLRPAPGDDDPPRDGPFERCLGADAGTLTAAIGAKAGSAQFAKSGTGTVSSSSAVFDQTGSAERVMGILGSSSARSCFEGLINARLARNPNLPEDVRGRLSSRDAEAVGDGTTAFRFEVKLPAEDVEDDPDPSEKDVSYLADFVFVRRGRVLALVEMANLRHPFDSGVAEDLLSSLAEHIPPG